MLSFWHLVSFLLPFFERDFRLKKRSKCPSWRSRALCRTRCQGRGFCVHRSEVKSLDRTSGRGKRSEEHTSELQSLAYFACRLLLVKKKFCLLPGADSRFLH